MRVLWYFQLMVSNVFPSSETTNFWDRLGRFWYFLYQQVLPQSCWWSVWVFSVLNSLVCSWLIHLVCKGQFFTYSIWIFAANVNSSDIVAAASLVARTLYILAIDKKEVDASALTAINVNSTLVEVLLGCLLNCDPGLQCEMVKHYISPSATCPSHYAGVILGEPSFVPYPGYILDVPRFVWNFLADKTSRPSENMSSSCPKDCSDTGEVCVRMETDGKGACVLSTTR